ncbi:putative peroxiredoxin pmp20 [Neolecta irregularis DAH-3]|uniref:Putative peroxiredoxin pmp20 n=1 Tax=Neolecta irregularis (strain DAH-3) TaxID=1198029 RepID=A0A1U7LIM0_NEOID|nr:putative peroxiredoxin pmp20 [Neolecta irregularis DAH-3]|eukprot:OLL22497.1 putative peroxiredoxin pmp20 [Neolecta irregularis DAH-3]
MFISSTLRLRESCFSAIRLPAHRFSTCTTARISVGEYLPVGINLYEKSPSHTVDLGKETVSVKKALVIGVPAAFSPACSGTHIPQYISSFEKLKAKGIIKLYILSVNDVFVMNHWKKSMDLGDKLIHFLADPAGKYTQALNLGFDATDLLGGNRSKRYALIVENGQVQKIFVEPDNTGVDVSRAEAVIKEI